MNAERSYRGSVLTSHRHMFRQSSTCNDVLYMYGVSKGELEQKTLLHVLQLY